MIKASGKRFRKLQPSTAELRGKQNQKPDHQFFGPIQKATFFNPSSTLNVRRKQASTSKEEETLKREAGAKEEKEEQAQLKRYPDSPTASLNGASSYIKQLSATGEALPKRSQTFFSRRLGYDFQDVKIHRDEKASQSARQVNAKAYTVGKNIVFNSGKYNPDSREGKELLAHELVHVMQNDAKHGRDVLNRVPAGFDIRGIYPDAASFPNTIFFDYGRSRVPSSEMGKIPGIATPPTRNITLVGTASEEGDPASNAALINSRIRSVDRKLKAAGHTGARTHTPQTTAGSGNIDYRRVRAVDVIPTPAVVPPGGAMPLATPSCAVTATNPTPKVIPCGTSFTGAFPNAQRWTLNALLRMSMGDPFAIIETAILFPGIPAVTVMGHIASLVGQLALLPTQHRCHNTCDGGCSRPAYNDGTGTSAMMTLCTDYINLTNQNLQTVYLIHESLHATPGLSTDDTAYYTTRLISNLTGPQALNNTDSFVLLILRLNGIAPPGGSPAIDTYDASLTPAEKSHVKNALAYLEQWLVNAEFDTSLLYDAIDRNIGSTSGWSSSDDQEAEIAHAISPFVRITDPGSASPFTIPPVKKDKVKVAGMHHRYTTIIDQVYLNALTINRINSGRERWDMGADTIYVRQTFFTKSPENAVRHLLKLLIKASKMVPRRLINAYIESANEIRKLRSVGP